MQGLGKVAGKPFKISELVTAIQKTVGA